MRVRYSAAAEAELAEAVDWYASRPDGGEQLADRFLDAVLRTERLVAERPWAWTEVETGVRRAVVNRFPYALLFEIANDGIQVLAVAHHRREPGYWHGRG